jgi:hypothetical protein
MSEQTPNDILPIPHALGVERAVLSNVLQYPEKLDEAPDLTSDHFHIPAHRNLFEQLRESHAKGEEIELVSLIQKLHNKGILDRIGGPAGLTEIYTYSPSPSAFRQHIEELDFQKVRRESIAGGQRMIRAGYESGERQELIEAVASVVGIKDALENGGPKKPSFPLVHASEIEGASEPEDFVENLLTMGGASVVYGPSNCGKSFWVLDLAASVATGRPFRDEMETEKSAVVYVALEGTNGVRNRINAMRQEGLISNATPIYLCFSPVCLLTPGHAGQLAEAVKKAAQTSNLPCKLVILDTLARAMAGGDENAGKDMTEAVKAIDSIRTATGAHVLVVHHCGKDEAKGARGHSSLRAAVDTEIEVSRPESESISTVRITKQRDMPMGDPMPFSLRSISLGIDRRGKPITSCVVHHEDSMMANTKSKPGRPPAATDDELLGLLPAESTAAWQKAAKKELGVSRSAFHRALKRMKGTTAAQGTGGNWVSL